MILTRTAGLLLFVVIGQVGAPSGAADRLRDQDPARLEAAAISIATSGNPADVALLADHLGQRAFLRRLDPSSGGDVAVLRLRNVFRALAEHPSDATAALCLTLARTPDFTAEPSRINLLLNALIAVRPMSQAAADFVRSVNSPSYIEVSAPLLAVNASPRALELLSQMFLDDTSDIAQRVSMAHWSLLPTRTDLRVVQTSARVLQNDGLSHDVRVAILESLYDYQPRRWFGLTSAQPAMPAWSSASRATRAALQSLGNTALTRSDLPADLRTAILKTLAELASAWPRQDP